MAVAVAMRSAKLPVAAAAAADVATKTAAQIGGPTADTSWNKWLPEPFFHIFLCFFHVFSQIEESFGSEGSSDGAFGEHVGVCGRAFRGLRALGMHRDAKKTVVPSCYMTMTILLWIICDSRIGVLLLVSPTCFCKKSLYCPCQKDEGSCRMPGLRYALRTSADLDPCVLFESLVGCIQGEPRAIMGLNLPAPNP